MTVAALVAFRPEPSQAGETLKAGDPAPRVEGKDQEGRAWKLADAISQGAVLLYFYPKDDTPGCTKEACGFRDHLAGLKGDTVTVVGVSFDAAESHQKFIAKYKLAFPLLADVDGKIADAFGARIPGKDMARRVSYLIGRDGRILHVTDSPSADTHLSEMKAAIEKLAREKH